MKRPKYRLLDAGLPLTALGVLAATYTVSDPGSTFAVPFLALVGIIVTLLLARTQKDPERAAYLRDVMILGVGVRLLLFALIHATIGPYVFAPDAFTYETWGRGILSYFRGETGFPDRLEHTLQLAYPGWNALLFWIFGEAKAAPGVTNIFFSCWTAIPIYHLTLAVVRENRRVARIASFIVVMFPSMILWSVLNVREAQAILVITICLYYFVRLQKRTSTAAIVGIAMGLGVLTLYREYLTMLVGAGGVAGVIMGKGRRPDRLLVFGSFALLLMTLGMQSFGIGSTLTTEAEVLQDAQRMRTDFQMDAGSAYGQGANVTSVGGAILFLPIGLSYFLFAPFPWAIRSMLQAITLPETLIWYALVPFVVRGARLAWKHDLRSYTPLLATFVMVTFAYALVESNIGTAYRHRAQVLPVLFVFGAVGLQDWYATWSRRRRARLETRRRVAEPAPKVPFPPRTFVRR